MPVLQHRLLRLREKLSGLGLPSSANYNDGYDESALLVATADGSSTTHHFISQQITALLFLECTYIRVMNTAEERRKVFGGLSTVLLQSPQQLVSAFNTNVLLPYFRMLLASDAVAEVFTPPMTRCGKLVEKLSSSSANVSIEALTNILTVVEIVADVALGFAALETDEKDGLLVPSDGTSRLTNSTSDAPQKKNNKHNKDSAPATTRTCPSSTASAVASVTQHDERSLEAMMLNLIALFGIPPPPRSDGNNKSYTYLQRLTRLAARCVFLGQRIAVSPKNFTMEDAKRSLSHVPLFDPSSKPGSGTELEQYTQALRLLLTLETELLQKFATMVVDEAQAFTAQCAFDPSGHKVGI